MFIYEIQNHYKEITIITNCICTIYCFEFEFNQHNRNSINLKHTLYQN